MCIRDRLSSNQMGNGSEELGQILMKGFIFALTELDELPSTVLLLSLIHI